MIFSVTIFHHSAYWSTLSSNCFFSHPRSLFQYSYPFFLKYHLLAGMYLWLLNVHLMLSVGRTAHSTPSKSQQNFYSPAQTPLFAITLLSGAGKRILHLQMAASHMGARSRPSCSTFKPPPCLQPGRTEKEGSRPRDSALAWET